MFLGLEDATQGGQGPLLGDLLLYGWPYYFGDLKRDNNSETYPHRV